jgi:hypothetical protein
MDSESDDIFGILGRRYAPAPVHVFHDRGGAAGGRRKNDVPPWLYRRQMSVFGLATLVELPLTFIRNYFEVFEGESGEVRADLHVFGAFDP